MTVTLRIKQCWWLFVWAIWVYGSRLQWANSIQEHFVCGGEVLVWYIQTHSYLNAVMREPQPPSPPKARPKEPGTKLQLDVPKPSRQVQPKKRWQLPMRLTYGPLFVIYAFHKAWSYLCGEFGELWFVSTKERCSLKFALSLGNFLSF